MMSVDHDDYDDHDDDSYYDKWVCMGYEYVCMYVCMYVFIDISMYVFIISFYCHIDYSI